VGAVEDAVGAWRPSASCGAPGRRRTPESHRPRSSGRRRGPRRCRRGRRARRATVAGRPRTSPAARAGAAGRGRTRGCAASRRRPDRRRRLRDPQKPRPASRLARPASPGGSRRDWRCPARRRWRRSPGPSGQRHKLVAVIVVVGGEDRVEAGGLGGDGVGGQRRDWAFRGEFDGVHWSGLVGVRVGRGSGVGRIARIGRLRVVAPLPQRLADQVLVGVAVEVVVAGVVAEREVSRRRPGCRRPLAGDQVRGAGEFVDDGLDGDAHLPAVAIRLAAPVASGGDTGPPQCDGGLALAERAPEVSVTTTAGESSAGLPSLPSTATPSASASPRGSALRSPWGLRGATAGRRQGRSSGRYRR